MSETEAVPLDDRRYYWPCACVQRDRDGNLAKIKMNHRSVKRCRKCEAVRPDEWLNLPIQQRRETKP